MLDIKFIRENQQKIKQNITNRGFDPKKADVDKLLLLDEEYKKLLVQTETLRSQRNALSLEKEDADRTKGQKIKEELKKAEGQMDALKKEINSLLSWIPNVLSDDTPIGKDDNDNIDLKVWLPESGYLDQSQLGMGYQVVSKMPKLPFKGKEHTELGKELGVIDTEQSALTSGSRFCYLKNEAVLLQYAIFDLLFKELLKQGFSPMVVPLLVKEKVLFGTSHFPESYDQIYKIGNENVEEKNSLYLIGSSEPSLFAYGMDKKFSEEELPLKMCAYSTCFRSEVGSWGKDVKGIKRVHQFDKLEMDAICLPEQADKIFEQMVAINEWLMQNLKLPYRIIQKCTGDAGYAASHKQYDVEVWRLAVGEFMETMTATNTTDYQARRLNIRYQKKDGEKGFCYTINDTGVAMGRIILAILENYQQEDGSVIIPEVLRGFVGKDTISPSK